MIKYKTGYTTIEFIITVLVILASGGWIANIVKIVGSSFDPLTGIVIIRVIGIFVYPLGAVLGFI